MTAFHTEFRPGRRLRTAPWAQGFQACAALDAELGALWIFKIAIRTFHHSDIRIATMVGLSRGALLTDNRRYLVGNAHPTILSFRKVKFNSKREAVSDPQDGRITRLQQTAQKEVAGAGDPLYPIVIKLLKQ